jgi:flavin-dependent dehydrogenase
VRARWVLDCTGRTGVLARATRRGPAGGLRTMALVGEWERRAGWGLPDESHTLVESTDWGWGWSVPLDAATRLVTVMMDPQATPLPPGPALEERYRLLLSRLPALGSLVAEATPVGNAWACDATPYEAEEVAGPGTLLVGDAASFIDPLSSFGVKKALASAWLAAITVHTNLVTPELGEPAIGLFREREREYVRGTARELGSLSREADEGGEGGYWAARATMQADELEAALLERLRRDPDVLAAFDLLRETTSVRLARSPQLRTEPRPVIRGNLVVLDEHLVLPGFGQPVRWVRNVDLDLVLDVAGSTEDVGEMYTRYTRRQGPVPLPDFLGALSVLLGKGGLVLA